MSEADPTPTEKISPREQGYRMPAEWEHHAGTWVSWPHKKASWPGKIDAIKPIFAKMVAELSRSETVHININDEEMQAEAVRYLSDHGPLGDVVFHRIPTNDAWCRDHGAIFVKRDTDQSLCALDWKYNAWGNKYPPFDLDNRVPRQMAEFLEVPRIEIPWVLEGGSFDVNGEGVLLTTESCLLNPNRNPELTQPEIEQLLQDNLGALQILWLGDGIVGDDTDGHIDDITRFINPTTVVTAVERNEQDDNYVPLQENLTRLKSMRLLNGQPLNIIELPMPRPIIFEGERLPASYANFYIANTVVLLPFYGGPADGEAQSILESAFPNRQVIGIDCTDLIWGLGAFHCLTQQVPESAESL